jgi:hypothetical protein
MEYHVFIIFHPEFMFPNGALLAYQGEGISRSLLSGYGIRFDPEFTQFYQGLFAGTGPNSFEYGGSKHNQFPIPAKGKQEMISDEYIRPEIILDSVTKKALPPGFSQSWMPSGKA